MSQKLIFLYKNLHVWNVPSTATLQGNPSKVQSHFRANNKHLNIKFQINSIFCLKFLYIPKIGIVLRQPTLRGNPSKVRSHPCANNKFLNAKNRINLIFFILKLAYSKFL